MVAPKYIISNVCSKDKSSCKFMEEFVGDEEMIFDDVLEIKNGKNQKVVENPDGKYPIYGSGGVMGYADEYICEAQTVIVGRKGSINNPLFVEEPFWNVDTAFGLCAKREILLPRYLYYFCRKFDFERLNKAVTIPSLTKSDLLKIEIDLPDLVKQQDVVDELLKVELIIELRKQELQKLDDLIKARFVEMFGDPIRNTQNRPITNFINVVKMQRGFDLPVQDRQQDGNIPVLGSNGAFDRHNVAKVQGGGVITGRSGTIGKVYYVEEDYWPLNTSLFSVDTHGNNIIYLAYLLQMYDLSRFTEGTGVPTLNRNKFHDKPIIDVSLNEQEHFASFVKQIDKSKVVFLIQENNCKEEAQ